MDSRSTRLVFASVLAALAAGCGGSDDGGSGSQTPTPTPTPSAATVKGTFVDSPVAYLGYSCGAGADATSGVTDSLGQFDYVPAASGATAPLCTFKVGGVVLGTASAAATIMPYDLVPGASKNDKPTNPKVLNIARFLQSIDTDSDASNGILIPAETSAALAGKTLDFGAANFDTLAAALLPAPKTLVSGDNAKKALESTLLAVYAGHYSCTYSANVNGNDTVLGTVSVTITWDVLTGTGLPTYPTTGQPFDVDGAITAGGVSSTSTSTGATFDGSFSVDSISKKVVGLGHWTDPGLGNGVTGTWQCTHD